MIQIRSSIVSSSRLKWIDDLRAAVADLLGLAISIRTTLDYNQTDDNTINTQADEMNNHFFKIQLLLDMNNRVQHELVEMVRRLGMSTSNRTDSKLDNNTFSLLKEAIVSTTYKVTQVEWDKIKRFK